MAVALWVLRSLLALLPLAAGRSAAPAPAFPGEWLGQWLDVSDLAPDAGLAAAEGQADSTEATLAALTKVILEVLGSGLSTGRLLSEAFKNSTWAAEHGGELVTLVGNLQRSWGSIQEVVVVWENITATGDEGQKQGKRYDSERPGTRIIQLLMVSVLIVAGFATLRQRQSFDLFSPLVYSRGHVSVAFTIASFVSLAAGNSARINSFSDNPFSIYIVQLLVCFFGVFSTLPIVVGVYQGSSKFLVTASFICIVWFLAIWVTSSANSIQFFLKARDTDGTPTKRTADVVVTVLGIVLLVFSGRHLALHLCPREPRFPPFYKVHAEACQNYLRNRLRPGAATHLPVHLPVALCICMLVVSTFMVILFLSSLYWAISNYTTLHDWVMDFVFPLQPLFTKAGYPLPLDDMNFAVVRSLICFSIALVASALVTARILLNVVFGYEKLFTQLARDQRYQGRSVIEKYGPKVFDATWGTYLAGALMGNCIMASTVIGLLSFSFSMILSLSQFWAAVWSEWRWGLFYILLRLTQFIAFKWVVPIYVVTSDGSVVRPRCWALLFPTLTLLNFIVGATAGVVRSVVLMPFLLVRFFRVDLTILPDGQEDWDWSFQPFLSLVMHAHSRLNPVMWAVLSDWGGGMLADGEGQSPKRISMQTAGRDEDRTAARSLPSQRAVNRWHLAVLLARNPSLAAYRVKPLQSEAVVESAVLGGHPKLFAPLPGHPARMSQQVHATTGTELQVLVMAA